MSTILNVLSLPELQHNICCFLNTTDFYSCTLVSKEFSLLFLPYIWTALTLKSLNKKNPNYVHMNYKDPSSFFSYNTNSAKNDKNSTQLFFQAMAKYRNYIQSLSTDSFIPAIRLYESFFGVIFVTSLSDIPDTITTPLIKLRIGSVDNHVTEPYQRQVLFGLLRASPNLQDISLDKFPLHDQVLTTMFYSKYFSVTKTKVPPALTAVNSVPLPSNFESSVFPNLRRLELNVSDIKSITITMIRNLLRGLPVHVEDLSILIPSIKPTKSESESPPTLLDRESTIVSRNAIKRLSIGGDVAGLVETIWLPFIRLCPNLEEFESWRSLSATNCQSFVNIWSAYCPKLSKLKIRDVYSLLTDSCYETLLRMHSQRSLPFSRDILHQGGYHQPHLSGWKTIDLSQAFWFRSLGWNALVTQASTLENFTYVVDDIDKQLTSQNVLQILETFTKLKKLIFIGEYSEFPSDVPMLNLQEFAGNPSRSLEPGVSPRIIEPWPCCKTLEVLRLGIYHRGENYEPYAEFMKQIGCMIKLQELWVYNMSEYQISSRFPISDRSFVFADFSEFYSPSNPKRFLPVEDIPIYPFNEPKQRLRYSDIRSVPKRWLLSQLAIQLSAMEKPRLERFYFINH